MDRFDVCVRGGGVVGLASALALARQGLGVALQGAAPGAAPAARPDVRTYALNAASVALLSALKVWDALPADARTAVYDMRVEGDAHGAALDFSAWAVGAEQLAWIVDAGELEAALRNAVRFAPHITAVEAPEVDAALFVLAEGKASATRQRLGVRMPVQRYGHRAVAASLTSLGELHELSMGDPGKARPYHERALSINERLYPSERFKDGHPELARSIHSLGEVLWRVGEADKALPLSERAFAMKGRLYPPERFKDGHAELAASLNSLGLIHRSLGEHRRALEYWEKALAMRERLHPPERAKDGHFDLAQSLNNLGMAHFDLKDYGKAVEYWRKALAMRERLYPPDRFKGGHPLLATSLTNMGFVLQMAGDYAQARLYLEKALEMSRRIYPPDRFSDGHPVLAVILGNLGGAVAAMGDYAGSMPYHEQSLAMIHRLNRRMTATASEAEALAFLQTQPHTFHGLLSFSLLVPDTAAAAYGAVWSHKAAVSRVLEQRHAAARVAGTDHAATFNRLREVRP